MTIYLIKWKDVVNETVHVHACSSEVKANAMVKEIRKNSNAQLIDDGDTVKKVTPKSQADVIELINTMF